MVEDDLKADIAETDFRSRECEMVEDDLIADVAETDFRSRECEMVISRVRLVG